MSKWEFLNELYNCDLCFGFWVYLFLAPFFKINMDINEILGWVILACLSTYMAQTMSIGHDELFGKMVIVEDVSNRK